MIYTFISAEIEEWKYSEWSVRKRRSFTLELTPETSYKNRQEVHMKQFDSDGGSVSNDQK